MLPATERRVPLHTASTVNRRIAAQLAARVLYYAEHPDEIGRRLEALDREWDVERTLEANASSLAFLGVALGATVDRKWLALPALVSAFLFQHATQGWCPPLPALRRLGFRTSREIHVERAALKALRGDFSKVKAGADPAARAIQALRAARGMTAEGRR